MKLHRIELVFSRSRSLTLALLNEFSYVRQSVTDFPRYEGIWHGGKQHGLGYYYQADGSPRCKQVFCHVFSNLIRISLRSAFSRLSFHTFTYVHVFALAAYILRFGFSVAFLVSCIQRRYLHGLYLCFVSLSRSIGQTHCACIGRPLEPGTDWVAVTHLLFGVPLVLCLSLVH